MANKVISKFEATMIACQKNKKLTEKKQSANSKKTLKESSRKRLHEEDELEDDIPEDVVDDIMVIIDPEMDEDDMTSVDELQQIIDETPEGEQPTTDEYIDDFVYTCPICGNNFFNETELSEGDACPVCGEVPDAFILVGDVAPVEEIKEVEETDVEIEDEDGEEEIEEKDVEIVERRKRRLEALEKARKRRLRSKVENSTRPTRKSVKRAPRATRESSTRRVARPTSAARRTRTESALKATRPTRRPSTARPTKRMESTAIRRPVRPTTKSRRVESKSIDFNLDEKTFNPILTKFIRENYKNARSMRVVSAKLSKDNTLKIECKIMYKSGKSSKTTLKVENFNVRAGKTILKASVDKLFKAEDVKGKTPITFECNVRDNVISCDKIRYNFVTVKENKKYRVYGTALRG